MGLPFSKLAQRLLRPLLKYSRNQQGLVQGQASCQKGPWQVIALPSQCVQHYQRHLSYLYAQTLQVVACQYAHHRIAQSAHILVGFAQWTLFPLLGLPSSQ